MYGFKVCCLIFSLNIIGLSQFNWQQVNGPTGGIFQFVSVNQLSEVVVASEDFGIYFSTDVGDSWIKRNAGLSSYNFTALLSDTAGTFVSTSDDGIFRYDKNQNQWVLSNFGLTSLDIRSLASDNFGNIFAGGDNGTVYRRNYSGNWESIFSADSVENISVLHTDKQHNIFFFSNTDYVIPIGGGLYKSSNNGLIWTEIGPDSINRYVENITTDSVGNIYFAYKNAFFRSTDSGLSWTKMSQLLNYSNCQDLISTPNGDLFALMSNPLFWPKLKQGLLHSNDGGITWDERGLFEFVMNKIVFDKELDLLYCATDKGLFRSSDFGNIWEALNNNMDPVQKFDLISDIAGTIYSSTITGIHRSSNTGESWESLYNGLDGLAEIYCLDTVLYATNIDGLFYFNNAANKWVQLSNLQARSFTKDKFGNLFLSGGIELIRSTNNGSNWQTIYANESIASICYLKDSLIIAATNEIGGIFKSTNLGNSWETVLNIGSNGLFYDGDSLIISITGPKRSEDLGITWENLILPQGDDFMFKDVVFINKNAIYAVAYNFNWGAIQFLQSTNYGKNWQVINVSNIDLSIYDAYLDYSKTDNTIYLGNEYIIHKSKYTPTSLEFIKPELSLAYELSQNYPNPFNPSTIIRYELPAAGEVSLKVYDLLGREVATLVDEYRNAGSYNVQFTINNLQLSSGIYFYQLKSGDYFETKKMILLK